MDIIKLRQRWRIGSLALLLVVITLSYRWVMPSRTRPQFSSFTKYPQIKGGSGGSFSDRLDSFTGTKAAHAHSSPYNSSLGFQSIQAVVMPHRDDQLDILALLRYTNELDIDIFPGTYPEELKILPNAVKHEDEAVRDNIERKAIPSGITACWRAHANVWRTMLQNDWQTALVLEGDADWHMDVREELYTLTKAIPALMSQLNGQLSQAVIQYDNDDPYMSESWDLLQLGHCAEFPRSVTNGTIIYDSPSTMPPGLMKPSDLTFMVYHEEDLAIEELIEQKRNILRVSLGSMCTTAYAISRRGAAKLLHKTTRAYDGPVDVAIKDMSRSLELVVLSVVPPLFRQRKYVDGAGSNSDMHLRKRAQSRDFQTAVDSNCGFDGEDSLWQKSEEITGRSATMAMSGLIWPEKTNLELNPLQAWLPRALDEVAEFNAMDDIKHNKAIEEARLATLASSVESGVDQV